MGRYSITEIIVAAALTAAFLFIFSLTVVPRPQPSPATMDLASYIQR
jgi:hypothetical protein